MNSKQLGLLIMILPVNYYADRPRVYYVFVSWLLIRLHDNLRSQILWRSDHGHKHRVGVD